MFAGPDGHLGVRKTLFGSPLEKVSKAAVRQDCSMTAHLQQPAGASSTPTPLALSLRLLLGLPFACLLLSLVAFCDPVWSIVS